MSNLLKSKFFLGVMIVTVLAVGFAVSTASAASCSVTPTVKVGSTGASVSCVQSIVGAKADGSFGPMTKAAVMTWQAAHNLTADGVVGPMTAAAMNGTASTGSSAGALCPNGNTLASNCSTAPGATAPALCPNGMTLASNCTTSPSGSSVSTGPLAGGAADINVTETSTDVETTVNEGATTKVNGFKIQADGGDVAVTNLKVTMEADGAGSPASSFRLNHYISGVTVWMGSTKVGSASADDFTKTGNVYDKSIALSGATVREGSSNKQTFYVTVNALDNIDSNDFAGNWYMLVNNIRFQDSTGVVLTSDFGSGSDVMTNSDTGVTKFAFQSLATSGDVKVIVSKDTSSPDAQNVVGDSNTSTKNVLLLAFKVKATGGDVTFDTLNITTAITSVGGDTRPRIASELQLRNGSDTLATIDGSALDGTETFNLDNTFTVSADTTEVFKVYATINQIDGTNLHSGSGMSASFASFSPEDANGDTITDTGSASGNMQTFVVDVPTVALVGTPTLALQTHTDGTTTGLEDLYKATIVMDITAPDTATIYVPSDIFPYGTGGTAGFQYTASGGTITSAAMQYSGSDTITDTDSYRIDAGSTQRFTATVYLKGDDTQGKVTMTGLWYRDTVPSTNTVASTGFDGSSADNFALTTGFTNFKTPLLLLAK